MGVGVVMADLVLCREELEAGTLVAPFPDMVCKSPDGSIVLIGARDKWQAPKVKAFRSWVQGAAEVDLAAVSQFADAKSSD